MTKQIKLNLVLQIINVIILVGYIILTLRIDVAHRYKDVLNFCAGFGTGLQACIFLNILTWDVDK